ncbi:MULTISPECIES: hemopexin repeat-containing protein [Streptomyces griseus group]|uniref:hemopexin repeat-containing protein n=1 Tax=Streptomyces griseus group TaxID=629295 RepID=UPI0037FE4E5C|nr:hypothetical protein OG238_00675 [Streptomyces anulatus]
MAWNTVDAAVSLGDHVWFFRGDQAAKYRTSDDYVVHGDIVKFWPALDGHPEFLKHIDAATNVGDHVWFFSGEKTTAVSADGQTFIKSGTILDLWPGLNNL